MSIQAHTSCRARLVLPLVAAMILAGAASPAHARRHRRALPPVPAPARPGAVATPRDSSDAADMRLARAAAEQHAANLRGVVEQLEPLAFATPRFAGAERAAFLLGHAYLELGDRARFERLARSVAAWNRRGPWTDWLAFELRLVAAERGVSALPLPAAADPSTALGHDLAGAALVQRATQAMERGEDARPLLEQVPAGSRYARRARHLHALIDLERGDVAEGRGMLSRLLMDGADRSDEREVLSALAAQSMDAGRWAEARMLYERADRDWHAESDTLRRRIRDADYDVLWAQWASGAAISDAVLLDEAPSREWTARLAAAAADLTAEPSAEPAPLDTPRRATAVRWPVAPPPAKAWTALGDARSAADEAHEALARTDAAIDAIRRDAESRGRYYAYGSGLVYAEESAIAAHAATLDALRARLGAVDDQLRLVRDLSIVRVIERVGDIVRRADDQRLWMAAMRHFDLDGPLPLRPLETPAGYPSPDAVLRAEQSLALDLAAAAESLAAQAPGLIGRSYAEAWRPRIIDHAAAGDSAARATLAWARRLRASVDSSLAAVMPDSLRLLEQRSSREARAADSLAAELDGLRTRTARAAAELELGTLGGEREGLDYGLAASAYATSVGLDAGTPAAAADTSNFTPEDPEATRARAAAIASIQDFLAAHPGSAQRGEMRFRLADVRMIQARQTFREAMARFVEASRAGRTPPALPTLDGNVALAIYRTMLEEDPEFEHLDAVMFNAGTIMADAADPAATPMFERLVIEHPQSRYCQEAFVRLGDVGFADHRYAECIPYYEQAAGGADTTLRVIALYKLGWSRFSLDRFMVAADAFRAILDVYAEGGHVDRRVSLADEAEAYLVHTLARAGGAPAAGDYFDRIGPRAYETRILRAMGQHFRRYSLYGEATATDRLVIARHPKDPGALVSAGRMIETYRRWERPALEDQARLELAPHFAPGGDWWISQASDTLRASGAAFARESWLTVADHYAIRARAQRSAQDARAALGLYETVITKWPGDPRTPTLELLAGESSEQLGDHPRALGHYGAASRSGVDSVATQALWQRVAVTDTWYQSVARSGGSPRADSLARAVIDEAARLLDARPNHPRAADLVWRQGNLALAHGWNEPAAATFGRLASAYAADARAPAAACLAADATFRLGRFGDAGAAYERALGIARAAGADSLARRAEAAIPVSYYRDAEAAVAADSLGYDRHANLFTKVADGWPRFAHADLARYRAGLAYANGGHRREAIRSMQRLIDDHPKSGLRRDAGLEIATIAEGAGWHEEAARAYASFARAFPADAQSGPATLKAAELFAGAGQVALADTLRLGYIRHFPNDVETAMALLEDMARRELAGVDASHPISSLLPAAPGRVKRSTAATQGASMSARRTAVPRTRLADYLSMCERHPRLASKPLLAQVRFLQGEEAYSQCARATLSQPLTRSIPARQRLLDAALARYRECVDLGDSEWAHGATFRIGQALVEFGDALMASERPADLKGEDLTAYDEVLSAQSRTFTTRGEDIWSDLLRQKLRVAPDERWIREAQASMWKRLGTRFRFRTESDVPLVEATPPDTDSNESRKTEVRK